MCCVSPPNGKGLPYKSGIISRLSTETDHMRPFQHRRRFCNMYYGYILPLAQNITQGWTLKSDLVAVKNDSFHLHFPFWGLPRHPIMTPAPSRRRSNAWRYGPLRRETNIHLKPSSSTQPGKARLGWVCLLSYRIWWKMYIVCIFNNVYVN